MDDIIKTWMHDILKATAEIDAFFSDRPKSYEDYCKDVRTKRAVERNIGIIGEAVNRIFQHDATLAISNARSIIGTRNRIIHGYDTVSDEIIWSIVIKHLPLLKTEIEQLLEN